MSNELIGKFHTLLLSRRSRLHLLRQRWAVTLARVSITRIPPCFLVSISVSISRLWSQKYPFQSWYQDSGFEVLIPVSISKLKFRKVWFQSRYQDSIIKSLDIPTLVLNFQHLSKPWDCLCKARNARKCNYTNVQNPLVWKNDYNFGAHAAVWCQVRNWISFHL